MPSSEIALVEKSESYTDNFSMEVSVTFINLNYKRPFVEGKILNPISEVYDTAGEPATVMRCYCHKNINDEEARKILSPIEKGTVIQGIAHGPSTRYPGKAFGSFSAILEEPQAEPKHFGILPSALNTKQTFTVSNMPSDLVERMDAKLDDMDVKRTYFLKKLINKFLAGDFDDDFV